MDDGLVTRMLLCAALCVVTACAATGDGEEGGSEPLDRLLPDPPPGAPPFDEALAERLARAVAAAGSDYLPRTRHLREDGTPRYTNRLILETSPYLRQHAHNPVNWYPWGEQAFETARRLGRPVLLSIGYSTCHWCHVMEHESFEDEEIAAFINTHYVAIKVDREERPDIDSIYMTAVQMLTGRGGWPMTTWLTPDRQPFYGGSYFPARDGDRGARTGFLTLLRRLSEIYRAQPDQVAARAAEITRQVELRLEPVPGEAMPTREVIGQVVGDYRRSFDQKHGGVAGAPKFPSGLPVRLLLRYYRHTGDDAVLEMAVSTLENMADGGIHDHVGGGFHRYATDERWLVPHFEKMLYDNALLTVTYLEGYQVTGDDRFASVASRTLSYLDREMAAPGGGFYSATDADSPNPEGDPEEGRYFTWTPAEIAAVLDAEENRAVTVYYGVTADGEVDGRNVLHVPRSVPEVARGLEIEPAKLRRLLDSARRKLYAARSERPAPLRDEKILAAWNGLAISAFARGGRVLGEARWIEVAREAARFAREKLLVDGRLRRSFNDGEARHIGYLEDYAFMIAGLLDLYEATAEIEWLDAASALQTTLDRHYRDVEHGGYFMTSDDHETLLAREKPIYDGAQPSGNSVAAMNLLRLHALTTEDGYRDTAETMLRVFSRSLRGSSEMMLALDFRLDDPREVVIVTANDRGEAAPFLEVLRSRFVPDTVVVVAVEGADLERQAATIPPLRGKVARGGRATAYVCRSGVCKLPTDDPEVFATQLAAETGNE